MVNGLGTNSPGTDSTRSWSPTEGWSESNSRTGRNHCLSDSWSCGRPVTARHSHKHIVQVVADQLWSVVVRSPMSSGWHRWPRIVHCPYCYLSQAEILRGHLQLTRLRQPLALEPPTRSSRGIWGPPLPYRSQNYLTHNNRLWPLFYKLIWHNR